MFWLKRTSDDPKDTSELRMLRDKVETLEFQVAEVEHERDAQEEMKLAFKMQALRLGDALQQCQEMLFKTSTRPLEVAQEDGSTTNERLCSLQSEAVKNGWSVRPSEVQILEQVGKGTTAITCKGLWHGLDVAVKCFHPLYFEDTEGVGRFCQEVELLSRQRHPYVICLLAARLNPPEQAWIVTEYFPLTLMEWLHGNKKRQRERSHPLPPLRARLNVAFEVALALQYLHELHPRVLHRDLKPSNIFLDDAGHVRVADFGMGRYLHLDQRAYTGEIGTYIYMAPEVMRHEPYDESCDVYSFGVILCELLTGESPYIHLTSGPLQIALSVAYENLRPRLPNTVPEELTELIQAAWHKDGAQRPTFANIVGGIKRALSAEIYNQIAL